MCSFDLPTVCSGRNSTDRSRGSRAITASTMPCPMIVSVETARCGPCCSIAAIEQHGPHLAVSTDTIIGQGMVDAVIARLPQDLSVLFLPLQAVGKSNEHIRSPGTITYTAETAQRVWTEIGESVARAGLRKMIIVTSHGGN